MDGFKRVKRKVETTAHPKSGGLDEYQEIRYSMIKTRGVCPDCVVAITFSCSDHFTSLFFKHQNKNNSFKRSIKILLNNKKL